VDGLLNIVLLDEWMIVSETKDFCILSFNCPAAESSDNENISPKINNGNFLPFFKCNRLNSKLIKSN
jgi:hypothetical protein